MTTTYCGTADIRTITNLSTADITDAQINSLIDYATYQLNGDIGQTLWINLADCTGNIDGINKQYSLPLAPLGDMDNDGSVGTTDMEIWRVPTSGTHYTQWTGAIDSIDDDEIGKFSFATAPSQDYSYIAKYVWFPIKYDHPLIKKACVELTSYMCFLRMNLKDVDSYKIGKVTVSKTARHPGLVSFYDRYQETLDMIRAKTILQPINWEMIEKMQKEIIEHLPGAGTPIELGAREKL